MTTKHCGGTGIGLLAAALLLWTTAAFGAPTTADQALSVARNWAAGGERLGEKTFPGTGTVVSYGDGKGRTLFHVVRLGAGTVILPGDDRMEPILAFLPEGSYDDRTDNPLRALVRRDLEGRFAALDVAPASLKASGEGHGTRWRRLESGRQTEGGVGGVSDVRVAPLVAARWNQEGAFDGGPLCYNLYTPENLPCGCVATALAQVMYTHRHPVEGVGVRSFPISVRGAAQTRSLRGGDGSGGPYAWDAMVPVPGQGVFEAACQAIGALTHDAGVASNMNYNTPSEGGSSAIAIQGVERLVEVFHFSQVRTAYSGANLTSLAPEARTRMINPNLDASLPVVLGISGKWLFSDRYGHAVVCDGYGYDGGTPYHHLNLGWGGKDDAWYNLPDVDLTVYPYSALESCGYNIYPQGTGEIVSGRVLDGAGNPVAGATVTASGGGETFTDVTDPKGIFALARIPSGVTYTLTSSVGGARTVTVGVSDSATSVTGNVWGVTLGTGPTASPDPTGGNTKSSGGGGCSGLDLPTLAALALAPLVALRRRRRA